MTVTATKLKTVLNLGCGSTPIPEERFPTPVYREIRVDFDARYQPDVVADIRLLPFADESADAILCHSCLEHIDEGDLVGVLSEFHRVLVDEGELVIVVPDLQAVAQEVVEGKLNDVVFESPAGPVRPLDILYGHARYTQEFPLMAHRTGFTGTTLSQWLAAAGFSGKVLAIPQFNLLADARKLAPV